MTSCYKSTALPLRLAPFNILNSITEKISVNLANQMSVRSKRELGLQSGEAVQSTEQSLSITVLHGGKSHA
jgi:hypothetical protein